jgi:hypothetical protein
MEGDGGLPLVGYFDGLEGPVKCIVQPQAHRPKMLEEPPDTLVQVEKWRFRKHPGCGFRRHDEPGCRY